MYHRIFRIEGGRKSRAHDSFKSQEIEIIGFVSGVSGCSPTLLPGPKGSHESSPACPGQRQGQTTFTPAVLKVRR